MNFLSLVFLVCFPGFLLEIEGSDLSRKVREAIPVHLVLVWSKSDVMVPSYGQTTKCTIIECSTIKFTLTLK